MSDLRRLGKKDTESMYPTRKPTDGENKVLVWLFIFVAVGVGSFCLYYGFTKTGKNPEDAESLRHMGFILLAIGIFGPFIGKFLMRLFIG